MAAADDEALAEFIDIVAEAADVEVAIDIDDISILKLVSWTVVRVICVS